MKTNSNIYIIKLSLIFLFISCILLVQAQNISEDYARINAQEFFLSQKGFEKSAISLKEVYKSADTVSNPLFCFQNKDGGFVVISKNGGEYIIVGYSLTGYFPTDNIPDAMKALLNGYEHAEILILPEKNITKSTKSYVEPLLDSVGVSLNQFYHENVGNCPTGCAATAMAIIMCYYKYPDNGIDSNCYEHPVYGTLCADFENTTYNWINPTNDDYELLSFHVGVGMDMDYCGYSQTGSTGSVPTASDYYNVLQKYFRYHVHLGSTETFYLINEINKRRPIYCELYGNPGHAVVLDGYDTDGFIHINFGWGGSYNGYFLLNNNSSMNIGGNIFGTNVARVRFISPFPFIVSQTDSLALVSFHNSMNETTGWNLNTPVVNWKGVTVMNERVISLNLINNLEGIIPEEIGNLTALRNFNIRGVITGQLPSSITNLTELRELAINYYPNSTPVSLPEQIGNLVNLEYLNISVEGTIPVSIGNLTKLKSLILRRGGLTGTIPDEIYQLTELEELDLFENEFTGIISPDIGQLTKLRKINLWRNQLSGNLPVEIGNLTELREFNVSENQFTGILPEEIGNWTNLQNLYVNDNSFSGMLPNAICNFTHFQVLRIENNDFSALPDSIGNLSNLQQIVAYNNMIDSIPASISNLSKLYRLDLRNNNLTTIPPLGTMPALWDLNLSNNQITHLPESFCNLVKIYDLYLANNQLEELPSSFENLSTLRTLSLDSNKLTTIPISFSMLTNLRSISLQNNQISGPLPPLSHLNIRDLDIRMNQLIFSDIAASMLPDDTVFTDSYDFHYWNQAIVSVTDSLLFFETGDSVVVDIRDISKLSHANNVYKWYKDGLEVQTGAELTFTDFGAQDEGAYVCYITNTKYRKLLTLETQPISILNVNDSLNFNGFVTTSRISDGNNEFTDQILTLLVPEEIRGEISWQVSVDSVTWHNIPDINNPEEIEQDIISIERNKLVIEPKSFAFYRYIVEEGTCNTLISDTIIVNKYSDMLMDTIINVANQSLTIVVDSIEIIIPKGFSDSSFRLTIEKLLNPPPAPDSAILSSVYDVNVSCGNIFDLPLFIKFKNINKDIFNEFDIDNYKPVYYDDKNQQWVEYENGGITLKDSTIVFYTNHLTKLGWWELHHGSYTHYHTRSRCLIIYKYGVGSEDNFYMGYELSLKKMPSWEQSWHNSNTDPDNGGTPYMIQDIGEYMDQIINKFESLGLPTPYLRFKVYVAVHGKGAEGHITASGYKDLRGYFFTDPTYTTDRDDLRRTLAHEYKHYTQDYFMTVLLTNYFWMEATAPLADRMVWDDTDLKIPEPEVHFNQALQKNPDSKSVFDIISRPWDYLSYYFSTLEKFLSSSIEANISSTFLHYMRSYRQGDKLNPVVLLKETSWTGSWLNYLDSYIQTHLSSTVGNEFDGFIKYILEGSNPNFTLLNKTENEDPFKYFKNNDFVSHKIFKFKPDEILIEDSVQLEVSYLASQMVQMYNGNNQQLVVQYKRKNDYNDKMKVYVCHYDSDTKLMTFEDVSDKDSSTFVIEKSGPDKMERKHVAFLLFINTDKSENLSVDYELKMYNVPEYSMLDYFWFTKGYGGEDADVHWISDGTNEELSQFYFAPSVYRIFADEYYSPMYYNKVITDSTIVTNAWSEWIEQTVTYNYITGRMVIYNKENWGGLEPTSRIDMREITMVLNEVRLKPAGNNSIGLKYLFHTNTSEETKSLIESINYTRQVALWNSELEPPGHNPITTYTYISTDYPEISTDFNHIRLRMQFW